MTQFRTVLLTSGLLLVLCGGAAQAQSTSKPLLTLQMAALPDPALPAEMQEPDAAGHDPIHGAGTQGRLGRGIRHP
jgi:hypothetical protein